MKDKLIGEIREVFISDKTYTEYVEALANHLSAKGYRKASEVAREIFEEIEELFKLYIESGIYFEELKELIIKLKKKYTESEKDDEL